MQDLQKLLLAELMDVYDAENQLIDSLPVMAEKASSPDLKSAFRKHLEQTKNQVNRLEQVFRSFGEEPKGTRCKGMKGLIDEGELIAAEFEGNTAKDAALICAAQKVEHYEITSYGCLCTWAKELGAMDALALLKQNLSEEKATDEELTHMATDQLNLIAAEHDTEKRSHTAASVYKAVTP
jgi:ferritin-like metal-binding protein YciE